MTEKHAESSALSKQERHESGCLIVIGGHEEKDPSRKRSILERVAAEVGETASMVISSVASHLDEGEYQNYKDIFHDLGVRDVSFLGVRTRQDAYEESAVAKIRDASLVFFTGGDQLRITSQLADSPVFQCLQERHQNGMAIAGTSAGAASMPETMLTAGRGDESSKISTLGMAPGLGLIQGVVVDSHFAERGRFGRLLGAVAENPKNIGLGIDENTAIVLGPDRRFEVIGAGGVYVMNGRKISYTSLSDARPEGVISIFGVNLHVLTEGDWFDLRCAEPTSAEQMSNERQRRE